MNFDNVILEKEQEDLLIALVEAARKQPRDQRRKFMLIRTFADAEILGLEDYSDVNEIDVETLGLAGFLHAGVAKNGAFNFYITPLGFRYYEHLMESRGEPIKRMEKNVFHYLDTSGFEKRHPDAYAKWKQAQESLWSSDSERQHTAIGHHCREAMQFFATSLVEAHQPPSVEPDITKTKNRVKAVIEHAKSGTSSKIAALLDAMADYWDALNDLAQRQEHGGQKEGEALNWEDSRRLVFHTVLVMTEIDRTLLNS